MTQMPIDAALFEALPPDAVLRVAPKKMRGWSFTLLNAKAAFEALAKCNDSTVKLWGIDPTERSRIAQSAEPASYPGDWVVTNAYPMTIVRKGAQGTSIVLWTIGLDGRVADCRTVVSSGEVELDKAACRAITQRGRYKPALGHDGKPMISHSTRKVAWRLRGTWSGKD
ncbi:energy transducer TonB [Sphingomonas faeni]|uniref:energy transducer TonB n=1 Tax=Sphingomonas faeni TaxID=185950 RepID=UPI003351C264